VGNSFVNDKSIQVSDVLSTKKDKKTFCHGLSPMVWIAAMLA
jgi:hypothetical protein